MSSQQAAYGAAPSSINTNAVTTSNVDKAAIAALPKPMVDVSTAIQLQKQAALLAVNLLAFHARMSTDMNAS